MFKNNNGKIIRKIAMDKMKSNKGRYWILLLTIAMTAILLTSTLTVGASYIKSVEYTTMRQVGSKAEGGYKYLTPEEYAQLEGHPDIKKKGYMQIIGDAEDPSFKTRAQQVFYMDKQAMELSFVMPLIEGQMPQKDNEVLVSTLTLDMLGLPHDVGSQIRVNLNMDDEIQPITWTVSGIYEGDHLSMADLWVVSKPLADKLLQGIEIHSYSRSNPMKIAGLIGMDVVLGNHNHIDEKLKQIAKEQGLDIPDNRIAVNWAYMTTNISFSEILPFVTLLLLLIFSGYLVIYNIFYIGIIQDIQFYGMLKTIGCTKKQVMRIVIRQGMNLTIRAIPAGLLIGYSIGRIITSVIIKTLNISEISYSMHPLIFVFAIGLTVITVYWSARKPAKTAGKVSPIEATKMTGFDFKKISRYTSGNGKKRRFSIGLMARQNIMRYKKKMVIVILSITISLVLLQTMTTATHALDMDRMIDQMIMGDYTLASAHFFDYNYYYERDGMNHEILDRLNQEKGIQLNPVYGMNKIIKPSERLMEEVSIEKDTSSMEEIDLLEGKQRIDLYGIEEESYKYFEAFIIEGKLDREKFNAGKGVVLSRDIHNYEAEEVYSDVYNIGESIDIPDEDGINHTYEILGFVEDMPYYFYDGNGTNFGMNIYMSADAFKVQNESMPIMLVSLTVSKEGESDIGLLLDEMSKAYPEFAYKSRRDYVDNLTGFHDMLNIVGYSLSGLLGLFGILNFINTSVSGILSRKQELAMLQTIGMTSKQLLRMLVIESLFITLVSIGLAFIIGGTLSKIVGSWVIFSLGTISFKPLLVISPLLMIALSLVPIITYNTINRVSLLERMKVVN